MKSLLEVYESISDSDKVVLDSTGSYPLSMKDLYDHFNGRHYDDTFWKKSLKDLKVRVINDTEEGYLTIVNLVCKVLDISEFVEVANSLGGEGLPGITLDNCGIGNLEELLTNYKDLVRFDIKATTYAKSHYRPEVKDKYGKVIKEGDIALYPENKPRIRAVRMGEVKKISTTSVTMDSKINVPADSIVVINTEIKKYIEDHEKDKYDLPVGSTIAVLLSNHFKACAKVCVDHVASVTNKKYRLVDGTWDINQVDKEAILPIPDNFEDLLK